MQAAVTTIAPPRSLATTEVAKLTIYASAIVNINNKIILLGNCLPAGQQNMIISGISINGMQTYINQ